MKDTEYMEFSVVLTQAGSSFNRYLGPVNERR